VILKSGATPRSQPVDELGVAGVTWVIGEPSSIYAVLVEPSTMIVSGAAPALGAEGEDVQPAARASAKTRALRAASEREETATDMVAPGIDMDVDRGRTTCLIPQTAPFVRIRRAVERTVAGGKGKIEVGPEFLHEENP
jgi:hypothetical protein